MTKDLRQRVADAMEAKRKELIAQPLARIWPDLADAAIAAMSEWNADMSQAPKDGSAVLLYFPKRYMGSGGISWGCFIAGEWLDSRAIRDNSATHWMPLPLPPHTEGE